MRIESVLPPAKICYWRRAPRKRLSAYCGVESGWSRLGIPPACLKLWEGWSFIMCNGECENGGAVIVFER